MIYQIKRGTFIIFIDESSFNNSDKNNRQLIFSSPRPSQMNKFNNISLIALVSQVGQYFYVLPTDVTNQDVYIRFLKDLCSRLELIDKDYRRKLLLAHEMWPSTRLKWLRNTSWITRYLSSSLALLPATPAS